MGLSFLVTVAIFLEFLKLPQGIHAVEKVVVRDRKPHPPVKGVIDHLEVEVTEQR